MVNRSDIIESILREMKQHREANMLLSSVFGFALSVVALSPLVAGDLGSVVTLSSVNVTNNPNDYFGECSVEIHRTKKSSQLTVRLPTKKELPDAMQVKLILTLNGEDPSEHEISVCEGLGEEIIGKSIVNVGEPIDTFPHECPFIGGDYTIVKWDPPTDKIPPGTPDGPFSGSIMVMEEGGEPYMQLDFEGELSHKI